MVAALLNRIRNSSLFYKYLISYALLLLLPVLIIGFFVYQYFVALLQTQVLQANRGMLEQVRDTMDSQIAEMRKMAIQISVKQEFDPEQLQDSYSIYLAKDRISMYSEANSFFSELVYKARGVPLLISSKSTYLPQVFYDSFLKSNISFDQYTKLLESSRYKAHVSDSTTIADESVNNERYISYAVPVPEINYLRGYKGTLLFLIKEKEVNRLLQSFIPYEQSNVYIMDADGNVITSLVDDLALPKELLSAPEEVSDVRQLDGRPYYVSSVISPSSGWTYVTVISKQQLMRPVEQVKLKATIALAIILILGSTIIYINMHVHYNPLRKLINYVDTRLSALEPGSRQKGLDKLHSAIDYMSRRSKTLESEVELGRSALRQQLLCRLLQGQISDWHEFREKCGTLGVHFNSQCYRVVCMQVHPEGSTLPDNDEIDKLWRVIVPAETELYRIDSIQPKQWVWLQSFQSDMGERWMGWHSTLSEQTGHSWTIGVGEPFTALEMIPKSYIGALTALQYHLILGSDCVIMPEDVNKNGHKMSWRPTRELEMLSFHLRERDKGNAERIIGTILDNVRTRSTSLLSAKYIYFELIHTLFKSASDTGSDKGTNMAYPDIVELTQCTSYQQMDSIVWATMEQIAPLIIGEEATGEENQLLNQMIELLYDKYPDPQFSIQGMSVYFSHSVSYLTRYFKEHTGQTISEYVHGIRIDEATRLLVETDRTIAEIVTRIGYSDPSSFIRKFKTIVHVTPGEFRKRMQDRSKNS